MKNIFKYGSLSALGFIILLTISIPFLIKQAFGPLHEAIEIKQNIGGKLICKSIYNADLHSWQYDIDYTYEDEKGKVYTIGNGIYSGREWNKDEQLTRFHNWLILKTGGMYGADKLLIGNLDTEQWHSFVFSSQTIENDILWSAENINSKKNWLPQEAFIKKIEDGNIKVEYLYRTGEDISEQERRLITYRIDTVIGTPKMTKVELKK